MLLKIEDQISFSNLSQDFNPMHSDEVHARRLMYGEPVAHGINVMILAIQLWSEELNFSFLIKSLKCRFIRPVYLKQKIGFKIKTNESVIKISILQNEVLKLKIRLETQEGKSKFLPHVNNNDISIEAPENKKLDELKRFSKTIEYSINKNLAEEVYDKTFIKKIGLGQLAELISYSKIVGMHAPGMNSIFSELNIKSNISNPRKNIEFSVFNIDERFNIINVKSNGPNFSANISAFYRPEMVNQANIESIKYTISPNEFINQRSIVIGGSRGLGEFTAKCLGYGNSELLITYSNGKDDAKKVLSSIKKYNKKVTTRRLDVCNLSRKDLKDLIKFEPTHIYYYPTPFIFRGIKGKFSKDLYREFKIFYVDAFKIIVNAMTDKNPKSKISFLYPSSVAIDEEPDDMLEYTLAKKNGENLCNLLEKSKDNIKIYKPRLPRMKTDQTVSLSSVNNEDPDRIIDILRSMKT